MSGEGFPQEHTNSDDPYFLQPLEKFPSDLETLRRFDVIIYGDVDPARLGPDGAENLRKFVTDFAGGVVFISGIGHNPKSLAHSVLNELLPVTAEDEVERPGLPDYVLTTEGREFFEAGGQEGLVRRFETGANFPSVRWMIRWKPKSNATVLVEADGAPLFVMRPAGKGRVFWSATDETWLWRREMGDQPYFYPFWYQAIKWAGRLN
jgi:uncharacterized membrane protein